MFTSILCPVDFSEHSARALVVALDLGTITGGHLTIVTVLDELLDAASHTAGARDTFTAQTQDEIQKLLTRVIADRAQHHERVAIAVVVGHPAEQILKQAQDCGSDLIVMGTQGRGAVERLVFGSTTERVLRESRIPVLAVPVP